MLTQWILVVGIMIAYVRTSATVAAVAAMLSLSASAASASAAVIDCDHESAYDP